MIPNHDPRNKKFYEMLLIWEFFDFRTEGCFVEVGANHPKAGSQTWLLELVGWSGLLIEPLPEKAAMLRQGRPHSLVFQVAVSAPEKVGKQPFYIATDDVRSSLERNIDHPEIDYEKTVLVEVTTLHSILRQTALAAIDFLSIDVEGTELDVLRGFDLTIWKPRLILIEDKLNDLSKHRFLLEHCYKLVKRTCQNDWYIPRTEPFHLSTTWERMKLFRKVFIGLPLRKLRYRQRSARAKRVHASIPRLSG